MSETLEKIKQLVTIGEVRISAHGYDELADDGLTAREVVQGLENSILIEDYPNYPKGQAVLVLQHDINHAPIHVVWGIPKGHDSPAVLVTAYRPDPTRWNTALTKRI